MNKYMQRIGIISIGYFIVLAITNFVFSFRSGDLGWFDWVLLLMTLVPPVANRRVIYIAFGTISLVVWVTILMAGIGKHISVLQGEPYNNPYMSQTSAFLLGYILTITSIVMSLPYFWIQHLRRNKDEVDSVINEGF